MTNNYDELLKRAQEARDAPNAWPFYQVAFQKTATPEVVLALLSELTALRAAASAPKAELTDGEILRIAQTEKWSFYLYADDSDLISFARTVLAQAAPVAVPKGWKLVPVEPTTEMFKAADKIDDQMFIGGSSHGADNEQVWNAMIDAAPLPPPAPDECDECKGTGQVAYETSGLADDGNAPVVEPCPMCGYGDTAPVAGAELRAIHQVQMPTESGSSAWHDASEDAYHTFVPERRRIVYAAAPAAPVAAAVPAEPTPQQIYAAARKMCDLSAEACGIDKDDNWAVCGDVYNEEAKIVLTVALAAPAPDGAAS